MQVIESCVEGSRKPEVLIYQETLRRLGVEASGAVFLDDIGSNLKTARDMGMATIKVQYVCVCVGVLRHCVGAVCSERIRGIGGRNRHWECKTRDFNYCTKHVTYRRVIETRDLCLIHQSFAVHVGS